MNLNVARDLLTAEIIKEIVARNSLALLNQAQGIYLGTCPLCGHMRSFTVWAEKARFRCFWCGSDGKFIPSPERLAATRAKEQNKNV